MKYFGLGMLDNETKAVEKVREDVVTTE